MSYNQVILDFVIFLRRQINTWYFKSLILVNTLKGISGIGIERNLPFMAFILTYRSQLNLYTAYYNTDITFSVFYVLVPMKM